MLKHKFGLTGGQSVREVQRLRDTISSRRPVARDDVSLRTDLEVTHKRGYGVSIEEGELGRRVTAQALDVGRNYGRICRDREAGGSANVRADSTVCINSRRVRR